MSNTFSIKCPECGKILEADEKHLGLLVVCSECNHEFTLWKSEKELPKYQKELGSFRTALIAQAGLPLSFKSPKFTKHQLSLLLSSEDCKRLFRFNHTLLRSAKKGCKIANKICYRKSPVTIMGRKYQVALTWRKYNRKRLIDWLRQMGVDYKSVYERCKKLNTDPDTEEDDDIAEETVEETHQETSSYDVVSSSEPSSSLTKKTSSKREKKTSSRTSKKPDSSSAQRTYFQEEKEEDLHPSEPFNHTTAQHTVYQREKNTSLRQESLSFQRKLEEALQQREKLHTAGKRSTNEKVLKCIEKFIKDLESEIEYLKEHGGQQYKLTDGNLISCSEGMWKYSFVFDGEAVIPDDIPIRLTVNQETATGIVISFDSFERNLLYLAISKDFGETVSEARINIDPWKLLEALIARLKFFSSFHFPLAYDIVANSIFPGNPPQRIPEGQIRAKNQAMNSPITVIWGPPGTGKTHTISEIALEFLLKNKKVLLLSQSNVSVDGMTLKIAELMEARGMSNCFQEGILLRYGHTRTEKLAQDPYLTSIQFAAYKNPKIKKELEQLQKEIKSLTRRGRERSQNLLSLKERYKSLQKKLKEEEEHFAASAQLLATTISKSVISSIFHMNCYDVVILDEASMAYIPQVIYAAMLAESHFICVGDFKQLAPIAKCPESVGSLTKDIFSFLHINDNGEAKPHKWLVMLDVQRRMHPDISDIANRFFYEQRLHDYRDMEALRHNIVERAPVSGAPLSLFDLSGLFAAAAKSSEHSRYNILSAFISFALAVTAENDGESSIGIITPYAAQARLIRAFIRDYKVTASTSISSATVHQFQGSERNLIVLDTVENYPLYKLGALTSKNENESLNRLVNVGITRARGKLIAVANKDYWEERGGEENAFFALTDHIADYGYHFSPDYEENLDLLRTLNTGRNITFHLDPKPAFRELCEDLHLASDSIDVIVPDCDWDDDAAIDTLYKELMRVSKEGITIQLWTSRNTKVPSKWKKFFAGITGGKLSMIIIDNELAWCGLPQVKDMSSGVPHSFSVAAVGHSTISTLKALTEVKISTESRHSRTQIKNKNTELDKYVEKYGRCTKCCGNVRLKWSQRGKPFLLCENCKNMDFLSASLINSYITDHYVTCPYCRGKLRAGLGRYGIYIKCEQGHFMKPHEI